ncbi:hypothetical protein HW555_010979 [Spodoptera exigua]|uniref:Uncharacterized protein n=1 Tax=Spodoptera exigua TaxID=7107 RepID=A0A835KZ93_SPOEX|nr:hypothetical protein HW555_010979 [Spodoptera exigua]
MTSPQSACYGDDAVSYVQVKRDDCLASHGGCKHAIAFLMWAHRRSKERRASEPSCTLMEICLKGSPVPPGDSAVLKKFLDEARKRKIEDCQLLRYQPTCCPIETHALLLCINLYLNLKTKVWKKDETQGQSDSPLWFELRYGRVTASRAFDVSRCNTSDGTLISLILGGKIPDTLSMKRGRVLEDEVRKIVELKLRKRIIRKCGSYGNGAGGSQQRTRAPAAPARPKLVERAGGRRQQQCNAFGGAHDTSDCRFRRYVSRVCNKEGHLRRMCPNLTA